MRRTALACAAFAAALTSLSACKLNPSTSIDTPRRDDQIITRMGFALRIQSAQLATLPELTQGTAPRFIRGQDLANLYYAYGAEPYWMRPGGETTGAVDDRG